MRHSRSVRTILVLLVAASTLCALWYASAELNNKNWDEGHSLRNVRSILQTGDWKPTFPFYPALSHLPQAALLRVSQGLYEATGNERFAVLRPNGNFTATAFMVGRATSVFYGVGALLMVFAVARRMFGEETALLATAVVAVSPYFLKSSGVYKPDALLILTSLVAFHFAVRAAESGRGKHYFLAGVAIGASAACKQNGAFSAIPLAAATVAAFREARRWLWLAAAAATSLAIFLAFNPWLELFPLYWRMSERYVDWASSHGPAPHLLVFAASLPFRWSWHGLGLGAAAWAGLLGLAIAAIRNRQRWPRTAGPVLLVLFVVLYPFACLLVSDHPKPNIFIATLPFTSIAAAWALMTARRWLLAWAPKPRGPMIATLAAVALGASAVVPYATYLYGVAVPTTASAAREWIERDAGFLGHRTIASEGIVLEVGHHPWNHHPSMPLEVEVERLAELTALELDLADYEVFPEAALEGEERDFYAGRLERFGGLGGLGAAEVRVFDSRPFRRRGPGWIVIAHPWRLYRRLGEEAVGADIVWSRRGKRRLVGTLSRRLLPGQVLSLDLGLTPSQASECRLFVDGVPTPIYLHQKGAERSSYMTRKFVAKRRSTPIRIDCPTRELFEPEPTVVSFRWVFARPPATAG